MTESFHFHGKVIDGRQSSRVRRTVTITGKKDLNAFADVLIEQARQAKAAGEMANSERLEKLADKIRRVRLFKVDVPLDEKLH